MRATIHDGTRRSAVRHEGVTGGSARRLVAGVVALAVLGCSDAGGGGSGAARGPDVSCTVGYRAAVTEPLEVQEIVDLAPGAAETLTFDEVVISFTYDVSAYEVPSLRIDAMLPGGEGPFSRDLYQFVDADPPPSFAGDTGFTGLTYLSPPGTSAEAQYLCTAS